MLGPSVNAIGGLALGVVAVRHGEFDEEVEDFVVGIWFGVEKLYVCLEDGKKEDLGRKARRSGDMVSYI
jgi:hypothetical protein